MNRHILLFVFILALTGRWATAQQYPDTTFSPPITEPLFDKGSGPTVYIDGAYNNFHQLDGGYRAFADLLARDGYSLKANDQLFSDESLRDIEVLVISNPINSENQGRWYKPIYPAFSEEEVRAVEQWVKGGGRLWLIADHMPFAGAAADLAAAFGGIFHDGFAADTTQGGSTLMCRSNGTLADDPVTAGFRPGFRSDSIYSFTGQAFEIGPSFRNIMPLTNNWLSLEPDTAWQFNESTPRYSADGWSQGALRAYGKGKVILWGEAAMFTAQVVETEDGTFKAGMNSPRAPNNYKLLLSLMEWLVD